MAKRKGPPLQLVILMAISGSLMLVAWMKLSSPDFSEPQKARLAAQYYLEALGNAPIERLGLELHPDVRRPLTQDSLKQKFKRLGLEQALQLPADWEPLVQSAQERSWRLNASAGGTQFPVLINVRLPNEMSLGRRWRVYGICRPDLDLPAELQRLHQSPPAAGDSPTLKALRALPVASLQGGALQPGQPLNWTLPDGRVTVWDSQPDGSLGCAYSLRFMRASGTMKQDQTKESQP